LIAGVSGASMDSIPPNATWLAKFAARLLQLRPGLNAIDAVKIAEQQYEKVRHLDPAVAAERYVKEAGGSD
jgi:hypothetical protein